MRSSQVSLALLILSGAIVAIDQAVKWAAIQALESGDRWLFGDWLGLRLVRNRGVAFGFLEGASTAGLLAATALTLCVIAVFVWHNRASGAVLVAGGMIAGGAVGNAIDRVRLGYVRDFVAVGPWPVFNVADAAITIGVVVATIGVIRLDISADRTSDVALLRSYNLLDSSK